MMIPALYALTLGTVGRSKMDRQTSLNEYYSHLGTAVYALIAGACSLYGDINWVYYAVAMMGGICCVLVMTISPASIDDCGARGLDVNQLGFQLPPKEYIEIFKDYRVSALLVTILLYHTANAAILPLMSQLQSKGNFDDGIIITAENIIISQITQAVLALFVGVKVRQWGTKQLFMIALVILPIRGILIIIMLNVSRSKFTMSMLSLTQVISISLLFIELYKKRRYL